MGVTLGARFVAYDPAGARRGILPYPLAAATRDVFNDISGGSIDYLADAQHSPLLEGLCEIAAEVNDGRGWTEFGARMMRLKRGGSEVEETRTRRYTLHSYGQQLAKMRMLREEALDENGERVITSATAGGIIKTLFDEAKSRGAVSTFAYDFTAGADSNGIPWGANLPPMSLRFGDDLLSLLRMLADNGACDWKIQGRTLRMFKPDTLGTDKSSTIRLFNGADIIEAPDDEDATEMAGRIGVIGDEGRTYEAISPSMNPWGLWEETVNASGVKDIGGLQFIGEAEQRRRSAPRVQMTRKVRTVDVRHLPVLDYAVGDTITVPSQTGEPAAVRVRELQLDLSSEGVAVNATLNDLILERDIRDRRNWQGMLGGASSSSGGSGAPSTDDDKRAPAVPTGFVCASVHLWSPTGEPFAVLDAAFAPVTKGADGRDLAVGKHELYARRDVLLEPWRKLTDAPSGVSRITFSPMPVDEEWQFKLRAVSVAGKPGEFTEPVTLKLAADTTPPERPSAPGATTRLGQIVLSWDGRTHAGDPQEIDFAHGDVLMATSAAGAAEVVGQISPSGTFVAPEQPYNEQRWFSIVAVDTSGNRSPESARVTVTTKPLVDTDLIGRVIDGANVKLDSIQENVIAAGAVTTAKIEVGAVTAAKIAAFAVEADKIAANAVAAGKIAANAVTAETIDAAAVTAGKIAANAVTADKIDAGAVTSAKVAANAITAEKISADAIDGKTITGALIRTAAIGERSEITPSGFRALDDAGQELVKIGYGIPTGMQVRSPITGAMVPLANAALGSVSSADTAPLAYSIRVSTATAASGGPGLWNGWTRHSADNCAVSFVAVASRYVIDFSQFWTVATTSGSDVGVYVAPVINGSRLIDAGHPVAVSVNMNATSTAPEMRGRVANGSIPIDTTPGETYKVVLHFNTNGYGSTAVAATLRRRAIVATPVFS